jgi:beta-glucosidase
MRLKSIFIFIAALSLLGCGDDEPSVTPTEAQIAQCPGDAAEVLARIEEILPKLTIDQKAVLMAGRSSLPIEGTWDTPAITEHGIPGLRMIDGPRGASKIAGNATAFPVAVARGATFDPEIERAVGATIAREVRGVGSNVLLAPTVNVLRHPRWGRAQETYGADPLHIGIFGAAFIEGAQAEGMITTVKHYAVNSIEDTRLSGDVTIEPRALREIYLKPFERAVKQAHVASVMTAYNSVNGSFASENAELLAILYDDWGYAGFTMSDWVWGTQDTLKAVHAGLDLEMPIPKIYGPALAEAVRAGEVDEALLDRSVRRILFAQFCYGIDELDNERDPSLVETAEARELALRAAQRSLVLLKNDADALPLSDAEGFRLVVMGRLADVENIGDNGSSDVHPTPGTIVTPYQGLLARAGSNSVELLDDLEVPEQLEALEAADAVVLVVGYTHVDEGEGEGVPFGAGDRESLSLRPEDVALIDAVTALHERVIVVMEGGAAFTLGAQLDEIEALVMAWYPGVEGGTAIADLLFGDENFSGRLPVSFSTLEEHLPPFENEKPEEGQPTTTYGYFHDYRLFDEEEIEPLFPFGFGLSYVEVAYEAMRLSRTTAGPDDVIEVEVDVQNLGERSVIETVQVYVQTPGAAVSRPVRDLRAFAQIELPPGEEGTVTLAFPVSELGYWDEASQAFVLEPGVHLVEAGTNARELPLSAELTIEP